ncbi:MAG: hypothetical protein M3R12_07780, partial [Actinomycetota bacterium]|nr:hypothetical protein [Actinomycetota bacterium]
MKAIVLALAVLAGTAEPPAASKPLPERPAELATTLERTTAGLSAAIDVWQGGSKARGATPRDVTLWALHQQRLFLALTY